MSTVEPPVHERTYRRPRRGELSGREKRRLVAVVAYAALVAFALNSLAPLFRDVDESAPAAPAVAARPAAAETEPKEKAAPAARREEAAPRAEPRREQVVGTTAAKKQKEPPAPRRVHHVEHGDTLTSIALTYGTTVDELMRLNPGVDPYALHGGQRIRVP